MSMSQRHQQARLLLEAPPFPLGPPRQLAQHLEASHLGPTWNVMLTSRPHQQSKLTLETPHPS